MYYDTSSNDFKDFRCVGGISCGILSHASYFSSGGIIQCIDSGGAW